MKFFRFGDRQRRFATYAAVAATLTIGVDATAFRLARQQRGRRIADLGSIESAMCNIRSAVDRSEGSAQATESLEQAIAFFERKVSPENEVDAVLANLNGLAEANALRCSSSKSFKCDGPANYVQQAVELSLSGNFNAFYAFLLQLESQPYATRVTSINVSRSGVRDGEMEARIMLTIYLTRQPAVATVALAVPQSDGQE